MTRRVWSLRTHLSALLLVTIVVTASIVAFTALVWKVPRTERDSLVELQRETDEVSTRLWLLLRARQTRLEMLGSLVRGRAAAEVVPLLQANVGPSRQFQGLYLLTADGRVEAVALAGRARSDELVGDDLSSSSLFQSTRERRDVVWSGKYLSAMSGRNIVGVAQRLANGQVLIGEIAQTELLRTLQSAAGGHGSSIWVVDQAGEVIADTENGRQVGRFNLYNWPALQTARAGAPVPTQATVLGQRVQIVVTKVPVLDWSLVGNVPAGWRHPAIRAFVIDVAMAFAGCLVVGLLIAPFWAQRMGRSVRNILARAKQATSDEAHGLSWPRSSVSELNALSADLERVTATLQEREQKFHAIFNATPIPMAVTDIDNALRVVDVNEAWCAAFGFLREEVIGRNGEELGLSDAGQDVQLMEHMDGDTMSGDFELRLRDGQRVPVCVFMRRVRLAAANWLVCAPVDVGPIRRVEAELQALNQQLEARVAQRTQDLSASNAQLTQTAEQLHLAQDELVRSDKLAALGSLVAGVAHELNTPLGNGLMAVSTTVEATQRFRASMASGLRRSDLHLLMDSVRQGVDIAQRNLARAASLVQSFKQVAVDQTSAQRRSFELGEVVHEMLVSLRPSLNRTPYRIEVDVPATGLRLDSYPGALGQTIGNLIQNAVLHGFDGRAHGTVRITGGRDAGGRIWLQVQDDGRGIAPEFIERIFEPFMTTRQGRGGSGLGLHISRNAVESLLGGSLGVHSVPGQGTCFELHLPDVAPRDATDAQLHAVAGERV